MEDNRLNEYLKLKLNTSTEEIRKHMVANLNEMPQPLIDNARKLENEFMAESYLKLHTTPDNEPYLRGFVRQVVVNGEAVSTWKKGRVLIAYSSLADQLSKQKEEIFGHEEQWFNTIVKPDYEIWARGSDLGGIFVLVEPEADYRSSTPAGYGTLSLTGQELISVDPKKAAVHFRRWLASRMAAFLQSKNQLHDERKHTEVLTALVPMDDWTTDAKMAIKGLAKEKAAACFEKEAVPGFCGEDAFYDEI